MVVRMLVALGTLGTFAGMAIDNLVGGHLPFARDAIAQWSVAAIAAVVAALVGLVNGRCWGRWLGLAIGVFASTLAPFVVLHQIQRPGINPGTWLFLLGPLLWIALSGRRMYERYDAPAGQGDDLHARVVRWAVIANVAGLGALLFENIVFVRELGRYTGSVVLSLAALIGVLAGSILLAARKTAGLLVVAAAAVLLALSVGDVLLGRPSYPAFALAGAVAPGAVLALAAAALYARPMLAFLRAGR
jgi:hypothetical protein